MHLSNESLLVIIVVGIIAGFLAGRIVDGGGFGLIGDLIVGVIGALIGDWLLPQLNIPGRRHDRVDPERHHRCHHPSCYHSRCRRDARMGWRLGKLASPLVNRARRHLRSSST